MKEIELLFNKEEKKIYDGIVMYLNLKGFLLLDQDIFHNVLSYKIYYYVYGKNRIPYIKINYHFNNLKLEFIRCDYKLSSSRFIDSRIYKDIESFRDFIVENF